MTRPTAASTPILAATRAAASGPAHVTQAPSPTTRILLAGFGGPEGQDDVIPFLRNVTRGRGIPDERLEEVAHHYRALRRRQPDQRAEPRAEGGARGRARRAAASTCPCTGATATGRPYLERRAAARPRERGDTHAARHRHERLQLVLELPAVPRGLRRALDETGPRRTRHDRQGAPVLRPPRLRRSRSSRACATRSRELLRRRHRAEPTIRVLFSTHRIPTADARALRPGGDRDFGRAAPTPRSTGRSAPRDGPRDRSDVPEAARRPVGARLPVALRPAHPAVARARRQRRDRRAARPRASKAVVIVPLGFVSDHMEVLWDLDTEAMETARGGRHRGRAHADARRRPGVRAAASSTSCSSGVERHARGRAPRRDRARPLVRRVPPGLLRERARSGFKPAVAGVAP